VAVGAVDEQAIRRQGPVHLEDLWGPVTMTYEPDVGWVLNNEHLEPAGEDGRARAVRLAIEKNRHGSSEIEWRHHLYGERYCLQPEGFSVPMTESSQNERMRGTGAEGGEVADAPFVAVGREGPLRGKDAVSRRRSTLRYSFIRRDGVEERVKQAAAHCAACSAPLCSLHRLTRQLHTGCSPGPSHTQQGKAIGP